MQDFCLICVYVCLCVCVCVCVCARTCFWVWVSMCAGCPQSTGCYIFSVKNLLVDSIDIAKTLTRQHTVLSQNIIVRHRCSVAICQIFTTLYISDWNYKSVWPKPHVPSFSWSMCGLFSCSSLLLWGAQITQYSVIWICCPFIWKEQQWITSLDI